MLTLIPDWLDAEHILTSFGPAAIWVAVAIVFIECGLLFPILPGDSLLFVAGILVAQDVAGMPGIVTTCLLLTTAAIAGNATGYAIGAKVGPALFRRPDSRFFKAEYLDKTHDFFEKYGAPAIILARFVPIVRTFITAVAGAGRMGFARFMTLSAIGGVLWATGITLMGYWLGNVDFIRDNVEALAIAIVFVSVVPIVIEALRHRRA
ncbi:MAG TPA: VTT domain-containing protein [Aeromicrobium sp.]|nr:VTT domain-containing protein [Aeromicrobium sp.]HKY58942.1 VTT domain-containing protein [Aeromicrobium sp.]